MIKSVRKFLSVSGKNTKRSANPWKIEEGTEKLAGVIREESNRK